MKASSANPVREIKQVLDTYLKELDRLRAEQEAVVAEFSAYLDRQEITMIEQSLKDQ